MRPSDPDSLLKKEMRPSDPDSLLNELPDSLTSGMGGGTVAW